MNKDTITQAAVSSKNHFIRKGNVYFSLSVVIAVVLAAIHITSEVEKMRNTMEWNTKEISELIMDKETTTDLRIRVNVLENKVENLEK